MSGGPLIVGIGGSQRNGSSSEMALRACLGVAQRLGATTECFSGTALEMPMFDPGVSERTPECRRYVEAVRRADGIVIATPGYHGAISGMIKNALDYVEDLKDETHPYFDGRAVVCVACAAGAQAAVGALIGLRAVVHSLRGWPTPLGVAVNSEAAKFRADGSCSDSAVDHQLRAAVAQVMMFADAVGRRSAVLVGHEAV